MAEQHPRAVGVFSTRHEAELALHELRDSGFPMDRISVIAKDADTEDNIAGAEVKDSTGNMAKEGAGAGAVAGTGLGALGGLLVGLEAVAIPGVGPFLAAGTLATTLAGAGIGAAAGGLLGALTGLGIPKERAEVYNDAVARGGYLVIVDGTDDEIRRAESILSSGGIREWGVYSGGRQYNLAPASGSSINTAATTSRPVDTTAGGSGVVEIVDRRTDRS